MAREIHSLIQGSDQWAQFRLTHFGASECAAMLGLSSRVKRTELLHMKHTGSAQEFSEWVQANILDYGHEVEALARPIIEDLIGMDLYPVTYSDGLPSASLDGLTLDEEIAFEHKQHNADLAAAVRAGVLPDEYMPQCQQIMMVTGAKKVIFVVSDGTLEKLEHLEVEPDEAWFERIRAGWAQFAKDLATYVPTETEVKALGRSPETLPALRIEVTGMVTASNLAEFKGHALTVIGAINRDLTTDQDFADAEKAVKWCGEVETKLAAAKEHALSQTATIDHLFKTLDDISAEARRARLDLSKLVERRKTEVKDGILSKAVRAYQEHVDGLKTETDGLWITLTHPDFAGAAKNKRTVASIQDGVDTVLANAKIAADASAKRIRAGIACIKEDGAGHEGLFADRLALVAKPIDDLKLVIKSRIDAHNEAEEKRLEAGRARIREEERVRAETIAAAATASNAAAAATESAAAAATPAVSALSVPPAPAPEPVRRGSGGSMVRAPQSETSTLRLGLINERLAPISLSADGLAALGFTHSATDKAAKLYRESEFPAICAALVKHIDAALQAQKTPRQQAA